MNRRVSATVVEALERRTLFAATISGEVMQDVSGNGLSADDTPLSGVVVKLFADLNGNGKVDATDGAALATKVSAAVTGAFSFTGLGLGKFVVQETPGANQVRTIPYLSNEIAVNVTNKNGTYANNVFANYVKTLDRKSVV